MRKTDSRTTPEESALRELQTLGSIGPACARDLVRLGIRSVADLRGKEATKLYAEMCALDGRRHDPCLEDAFRCAIAQANDSNLPSVMKQWWRWTPVRGKPQRTKPRMPATTG